MSADVALAKDQIAAATFAFEEALGVMPTLTAMQRRAVARAAVAFAKQCMTIQLDLIAERVRQAFD